MEEVIRSSQWLARREDEDGQKYALREDVKLILCILTVPYIKLLSFLLFLFKEVTFNNSLQVVTRRLIISLRSAARGRDNYSLYGVLRTKPGRADSPPALWMSRSDKIAAWNVLGIQGASGSSFLEPLYLNEVIIGEVPEQMRDIAKEDCERALWGRLDVGNLGAGLKYALHTPLISFTFVPFIHSRGWCYYLWVV
ncbi:hypothetical protein K435DRAFT_905132 [Dendrothele bispora CBS 962.96]|uniref:A to I editase domain-containing protein n=1 Tax=Dendrothele bispora (strain CBS 962.96) TaxID=1314807 RepID=A0A4S8LTM9_DENBC|nr:hypothetical protein K435DRAFT_905132 [Dendrothele bispora CBS 962.96]